MKGDVSIRAGVVLRLTLIAVASLSLQAVFALKVMEIAVERRHVEAAVSAAEVVRRAVETNASGDPGGAPSVAAAFARLSPHIRDVSVLPEAVESSAISVEGKTGGFLSFHPTVVVTLPLAGGPGGPRAIRVRYFSPGAEGEARRLVEVAAALVAADVAVFVLFGFFLMDRAVVRPVRRLASVTEKIAGGEYRLRADETPRNEVGALGESFNRMVGALLSAQEKVRRAEQETSRSEKLATVGRLAAGVAHEVGSPLMAIRGYAEYLRKGVAGREEQDECLEKIVGETRKIESIVRGLLSVAAPPRAEEEAADVNDVVRGTLELLSIRKMFRGIDVGLEPGDAGRARIGAGRLQQVLLNLLINAVDSMDSRGTLRIATFLVEPWLPPAYRTIRRRASDPPEADVLQLRGEPGGMNPRGVAVSVSDTGCGIRKGDMASIFDPFFTTKDPGKGTGLGLSVSRAIVESAGGEIRVESVEGSGSTFTVILPVGVKGEKTNG